MGQPTMRSGRFDVPCKQSGASRNLKKEEKTNSENWETKKEQKQTKEGCAGMFRT